MATRQCGTCQGRKKLEHKDSSGNSLGTVDCPKCGGSGEVPVEEKPAASPPPPLPVLRRLLRRRGD